MKDMNLGNDNGRVRLGQRYLPRHLVAYLVTALVAVLLPALVSGTGASAVTPAAFAMSAPAQFADRDTVLSIRLDSSGTPIANAPVVIERWDGSTWQPVGTPITDVEGRATLNVAVDRSPMFNRLRATYAGDDVYAPATSQYVLPLRAFATTTTIAGAKEIVDEKGMYLRVTWKTSGGLPVVGRVGLQKRIGGVWRPVQTYSTNAQGYVRIYLIPRVDVRYRAVGLGLPWAARSVSAHHRIENLPSGVPASLPRSAPRPRVRVPAQARATGSGANPSISPLSDAVWNSMVGRTWHRGCPVGRSGLRLLQINYWDYTGYRRRGELVAAASVVRQMAGALTDMYNAKLPIRSMYRVDRFGYSKRLHGGDDYKSMAAGNTSAFNCREVVGRPGVRSPHSYGRALDINTWENPYRTSAGWVPNSWWPSRSNSRYAWRSRSHRVVRIMAKHRLQWTYGVGDSQHFDGVPQGARPIVIPGCENSICD